MKTFANCWCPSGNASCLQENIVPVEAMGSGPFSVSNNQVGKYFDGIPNDDFRYHLNAYMKHRFPQE